VTPLMSKIYLRLVNSPAEYWEREGVLRFEAEAQKGKQIKAWDRLCVVTGVASATANKALTWLHNQVIIGYFSGKNGVGLRIFLNRAVSSIGVRAPSANQKNLRNYPVSFEVSHASPNETPSIDSFAVLEILDTDLNPSAPNNGANTKLIDETCTEIKSNSPNQPQHDLEKGGRESKRPEVPSPGVVPIEEIITRLRSELEPSLKIAATEAAARAAAREHLRTREWFEMKALPKAVRVAQSESYNLFRKYGTLNNKTQSVRAELEIGRASEPLPQPRPLSDKEILELAESCVAMLELQGKSVDKTLAEISIDNGGWLLAEEAPKVRETAQYLLLRQGNERA